jgi:predicted nucleotidyltransferase
MLAKMDLVERARVNIVPENWVSDNTTPDQEAVNHLITSAFDFCAKRSETDVKEIKNQMKAGSLWANSTFRYALAKGIRSLLKNDTNFHDLYLFGSVMEDQARLTSNINMVLHVGELKEAYETWILALNENLVNTFRSEFEVADGFVTMLDCHVVTDEEVSRRAGYGSMLASISSNLTQLN